MRVQKNKIRRCKYIDPSYLLQELSVKHQVSTLQQFLQILQNLDKTKEQDPQV
jgi:hypothetical protein